MKKMLFAATTALSLLVAASTYAATAWTGGTQSNPTDIKANRAVMVSNTSTGTEWLNLYTHAQAVIYVSSSETGTPSITITKSMGVSGTTGMISTTVGTYAVSGTGKVITDDLGPARAVKATVTHSSAGAVEVQVNQIPFVRQNIEPLSR